MVMTLQGLTLKQFLTLPEQQPSLEYFQGRVTRKATPSRSGPRARASASWRTSVSGSSRGARKWRY